MTPHQRAARINKLRRELGKRGVNHRPKKASVLQQELARLVVERMRQQLGKA